MSDTFCEILHFLELTSSEGLEIFSGQMLKPEKNDDKERISLDFQESGENLPIFQCCRLRSCFAKPTCLPSFSIRGCMRDVKVGFSGLFHCDV